MSKPDELTPTLHQVQVAVQVGCKLDLIAPGRYRLCERTAKILTQGAGSANFRILQLENMSRTDERIAIVKHHVIIAGYWKPVGELPIREDNVGVTVFRHIEHDMRNTDTTTDAQNLIGHNVKWLCNEIGHTGNLGE